jgi:SAM-dependent methyltransferase
MDKTKKQPWFEDEEFWKILEPALFNKERLESASQEAEQMASLLKLQAGASICDLCCGPGRHSLELSRLGYNVTGVDRTGLYIERARKKADEQRLDIRFVQKDMRKFCEPNTFDAVVNVFTSFGYFEGAEDDRRVIENVYKSLKEGGKFIIDIIAKEVLGRIFIDKRWREEDGAIVLEESKIKEDWSAINSRWIIIKNGRQDEFRFTLRLYSATELSELLKSCGFKEVQVYGNIDGSPYDQSAKRLVLLAQK